MDMEQYFVQYDPKMIYIFELSLIDTVWAWGKKYKMVVMMKVTLNSITIFPLLADAALMLTFAEKVNSDVQTKCWYEGRLKLHLNLQLSQIEIYKKIAILT